MRHYRTIEVQLSDFLYRKYLNLVESGRIPEIVLDESCKDAQTVLADTYNGMVDSVEDLFLYMATSFYGLYSKIRCCEEEEDI